MASFHCHFCSTNYSTKQSYERHLLTASHLKRTDVNRKMYKCECGKSYLYRQSLYSHKMDCQYIITQVKRTEEDEEKKSEEKTKIESLQKEIDALRVAVQHKTTVQTAETITNYENIHNNNTQNIHINCYGKEDLSYITKEYLKQLISAPFTSIQDLTRHIYFNEDHPENQNVKITNKKLPYASIIKNGKWELTDRKRITEEIMQKNYNYIDSKYEEVSTELSDNKKIRFERFQDKYDTPEQQKQIKKEVDLFLLGGGSAQQIKD